MKKPINNAELKKFIEKSKAQFDNAQTNEDIKKNFQEIKEFPYRFKCGMVKPILKELISIGAFSFIYFYLMGYLESNGYVLTIDNIRIYLGLMFFIIINSVTNLKKITKMVERYQDYISEKTVQLIYNSQNCSSEFANQQFEHFFDLTRGNVKNKLKDCVNMEFNSVVGKQRIIVFTLHSLSKISGNTENYYRQGVFFPSLDKIHSLIVSQSHILEFQTRKIFFTKYREMYKMSFMPASSKFKKLFKTVRAENELTLSKFLEPDVVLMFETAVSKMRWLNLTVEFNKNGDMIISQMPINLLEVKTKNTLENPDLLLEELLSGTSFPNLDYILGFANNLIKQFK